MTLKEKIQEDLKEALLKRENFEISVLRYLSSVLHNKEIEKKTALRREEKLPEKEIEEKGKLTDEEIIEAIMAEIKKRKESILEFERGQREDLVKKEEKEIEILKRYLPEQLSEEELKNLAQEIIMKTGASSIRDMGKVMGELMSKVKGRAQGDQVAKIVKELLSGQND